MKKGIITLLICWASWPVFSQQSLYPRPYGVLPTANQLAWQELEQYVIIHFTPTTFQNKEWGFGDADPKFFNPKNFDANQIVAGAKAGGAKGILVVAKHHDGFCLWPTKTTDYNISKSPFRNGNGDMIKEYQMAAKKAGLKFGIYCSPWDRNNKFYSKPEYLKIYREQLRELLTNYGELFISWYDGANGGDGFYGGANEVRKIDILTYYQWDSTWATVKKLQPKTVIFSDNGDVRWVGNESGFAGETSWETYSPIAQDGKSKGVPGDTKYWEGVEGTRNGKQWMPAECDVPLRQGWFFHKNESPKTPNHLLDLYFRSVGRAACLDLGLAPNTDGLLNADDIKTLATLGKKVKEIFAIDYAKTAKISATNIRNKNTKLFGIKNLIDSDKYSYWATDDSITTPSLSLEWAKPIKFNIIRLRENIKLGQRIEKVEVDIYKNKQWEKIASATSIGANRLIRLKEYFTTTKLRIRIMQSPVSIALSEIGVFVEPEQLIVPQINRTKDGLVHITTETPASEIRYTLDGTEPTKNSMIYKQPFVFEQSGQIKSKSFSKNLGSETALKTLGISKKNWKIISSSFENKDLNAMAANAIDEDDNTLWHTWVNERTSMPPPQFVAIDLGTETNISALTYTPRKKGSWGVVKNYEWQISGDGITWNTVSEGEFANIKANPVEQIVNLNQPIKSRYIKFIGKSAVEDNYISAAEIGIIESK